MDTCGLVCVRTYVYSLIASTFYTQTLPPKKNQIQHVAGRRDAEVKILLPACNDTAHTYALRLPFAFGRFSGPVLWPPGGLALYLNGKPVFRNAGSPQNAPAWDFDPPVAAGAVLRLCWNATEVADAQVVLHNALAFN